MSTFKAHLEISVILYSLSNICHSKPVVAIQWQLHFSCVTLHHLLLQTLMTNINLGSYLLNSMLKKISFNRSLVNIRHVLRLRKPFSQKHLPNKYLLKVFACTDIWTILPLTLTIFISKRNFTKWKILRNSFTGWHLKCKTNTVFIFILEEKDVSVSLKQRHVKQLKTLKAIVKETVLQKCLLSSFSDFWY